MKTNRDIKMILQHLENTSGSEAIHDISGFEGNRKNDTALLESYGKIWKLTGTKTEAISDFDVDAAWSKVEAKLSTGETTVYKLAPHRIQSFAVNFMKVAAVLLLGLIIYRFATSDSSVTYISSSNKQSVEAKLSDGSIAYLNNNSHINFPEKFGSSLREVYFWGEAYFEVASDKSRPFIIRTGDARIKVLGTAFNVKSIPGSRIVEVNVKEGKVLLFRVDEHDNTLGEITLIKGETGKLDCLNNRVTKYATEDMNYLSWKTGVLKYVNTPLTQVLSDVSKNYHVQLNYNPKELAGLKLTADFENEDIDAVIEVISLVHHLKFTANEKGFLVTKTG